MATSVTVQGLGTGDDNTDVSFVRLWRDAGVVGTFEAGVDVQLGAGSYLADPGTVVFAGLTEAVPQNGAQRFYVTYDMGNATNVVAGQTYQAQVSAVMEAATGGAAIAPAGLPASGTARTAVTPAITVTQVAVGGTLQPLDTNVLLQHLIFTETTNDDGVEITSVTIEGDPALGTSGEDDTDVKTVRLWRDAGGIGAFDSAVDVEIASGLYFADPGIATFAGLTEVVPANSAVRYFVTYDMENIANVVAGQTYQTRASAVMEADTGGAPVVATGLPVSGTARTAVALVLPEITVTELSPATANVKPGAVNMLALHLRLTEGIGGDAATLKSLQVRASGSGDDVNGISAVRLWRDFDLDQAFDPVQDVQIGIAAFFTLDGVATFLGLSEGILAGGSRDLFVTYDMSTTSFATEVYQGHVEIGGLSLENPSGVAVATINGLQADGTTLTVAGASITPELTVQAGAANAGLPTPLYVRVSQTDAVLLQVSLTANAAGSVAFTQLNVNCSGTAADHMTGIAAIVLYRDEDDDGTVSTGDIEVDRIATPFAASAAGGTASFTGFSDTVAASDTVQYVVSYDMTATHVVTSTFTAQVDAVGSFAASASIVAGGGFPVTGRDLKFKGGLNVQLSGANNPPGSATALTDTDVETLLVVISADTIENVDLDSITFTASGSADDSDSGTPPGDFLNVRLFEDVGGTPGVLDGTDAQVGVATVFGADNGTATFTTAGAEIIASGGSRTYLLVLDVAAATQGASFRHSIAANGDYAGTTVTTALAAFTSGAAVTGNVFTTGAPTGLFVVAGGINDTLSSTEKILDLAVADFDLDGDLDYAALRGDGVVEIRSGLGTGSFTLYDVSGALTSAVALAVGRMDTDAYPDLVLIHDSGGGSIDSISVFLNDGTGAFGAAPDSTRTTANSDYADVVLADYNRDGVLDVVVGEKDGGGVRRLTGRLGSASGALAAGTQTVVIPNTLQHMTVADVNGDGFMDVVHTDKDSDAVNLSLGNGTFFTAPQVDVTAGAEPQDVVAVDLNRDGFPDAVVVDVGVDNYESYSSDGRAAPNLSAATVAGTAPGLAKTGAQGIAVGDWNGDGKSDVVIAHSDNDGIVVRLGDGTLTFPAGGSATEYDTTGVTDPDQVVTGDFNRDGDADLLVASSVSSAGVVRFLPGDGQTNGGDSGVSAVQIVPWARSVGDVVVADFDLDGHPDVVATSTDSFDLQGFLNDGDAVSFTAAGTPVVIGTSKAEGITSGDFNRDGRPDVVLVSSSFVSLIGNGDGTFAAPVSHSTLGSNAVDVRLADLNGDGILDAVYVEKTSDTVQIIRGNGTGFDAPLVADQHTTSERPGAVRLGDMNRDGLLDVIVTAQTANGSVSTVEVFLNQGAFAFTRVITSLTQDRSGGLDVGDVTRDGVLDVVVLSKNTGVIELLEGDGDGTFTNRGTRTTPLSGKFITLVDLDKDGDLDMIQPRVALGGVLTYENTTPGSFTFAAAQTRTGPASTKGTGFADMNRDGEIDLVAGSDVANGGIQIYLGE